MTAFFFSSVNVIYNVIMFNNLKNSIDYFFPFLIKHVLSFVQKLTFR